MHIEVGSFLIQGGKNPELGWKGYWLAVLCGADPLWPHLSFQAPLSSSVWALTACCRLHLVSGLHLSVGFVQPPNSGALTLCGGRELVNVSPHPEKVVLFADGPPGYSMSAFNALICLHT